MRIVHLITNLYQKPTDSIVNFYHNNFKQTKEEKAMLLKHGDASITEITAIDDTTLPDTVIIYCKVNGYEGELLQSKLTGLVTEANITE
jgi:hypothetical protein